jgi:4-hydroxy-tetrahydrodipicolinate reductase
VHANPLSPSPTDEQSTREYRVVQWATGTIGARALRAVIEHPHMSLAGVYVHGGDKAGRDAGELCGMASTGVTATAGIDVVTTCGAFHHPASMDPEVRAKVQTACELGGTSVHCTGSSPGFITEAEPITCARVSARRCGLSPMRSDCPSNRWKQAASWRWPAARRRSPLAP